jgi:CheY-like chemotaxis protein
MGGDITVVSEEVRGATFTVRLVLPVAVDRPERSKPLAPTRTSVLLAFDRLIERRALAANIRAIGLAPIECDDPLDGDDIPSAAASGHPVTHVICDVEADPREAAAILEKVRAFAEGREVRGILIIDPETRGSLEQFQAIGFGTYLVRPIRPHSLKTRFGIELGTLADSRTSEAAPAPADAQQSPMPRHVLLAEDNAVNALLARRMLENCGCSVIHVTDGELAINAVVRSLQTGQRRFDLILMDVHMPRLDGLAAASQMRSLGSLSSDPEAIPPMVALTANAFSEDRQRCLEAGFDDYLAKPFHKTDLAALLERWGKNAADKRAA